MRANRQTDRQRERERDRERERERDTHRERGPFNSPVRRRRSSVSLRANRHALQGALQLTLPPDDRVERKQVAVQHAQLVDAFRHSRLALHQKLQRAAVRPTGAG